MKLTEGLVALEVLVQNNFSVVNFINGFSFSFIYSGVGQPGVPVGLITIVRNPEVGGSNPPPAIFSN